MPDWLKLEEDVELYVTPGEQKGICRNGHGIREWTQEACSPGLCKEIYKGHTP